MLQRLNEGQDTLPNRRFCREAAKVALIYNDRKKADAEAEQISREIPSSQILPLTADVSSREEAGKAISRTIAEFGALHVLVNNAATREYFSLAEAPEESWQKVIATNSLGVAS